MALKFNDLRRDQFLGFQPVSNSWMMVKFELVAVHGVSVADVGNLS